MPSSARRFSMLMARAWPSGPFSSSLVPVDREAGPALGYRHQFERVDVEMRRQGRDPPDRLGDILGRHWIHIGVEAVARRLVAAGADQREFGFDHPGLDRGYAHAGPGEVAAK